MKKKGHNIGEAQLGLPLPLAEDDAICYIATHKKSGMRYVGMSGRSLHARRLEHESHSASGTFDNSRFHLALQKYGKDSFAWEQVAQGKKEAMQILERTLISQLHSYHPNGFNSINAATEPECYDADTLRFFESMDTMVDDLYTGHDLMDALLKAMNDPHFTDETKEMMSPLIDHLKSGKYRQSA